MKCVLSCSRRVRSRRCPYSGDPENQRVTGGPIDGGSYSILEVQGGNEGTYRVEIRWPKPTGKQFKAPDTGEMKDNVKEAVPAKYNIQSELTAAVTETTTNFDFDLKSK